VPFTDLSATKKRPVLIISNDGYNNACQDIIVAAVTSNLIQPGVSLTNDNLTQGHLPKPSIVRSDKVYTLNQNIVIKQIGCVADSIIDEVCSGVVKFISK
jgi:mRNA interferase MazF